MDPRFNPWSVTGGGGYSSSNQLPNSTGRGYALSMPMPSFANNPPPNYYYRNGPIMVRPQNQRNPPPNYGMQTVPTNNNNNAVISITHNPPRNHNGNSNRAPSFVIDRKRENITDDNNVRNVRIKTEPSNQANNIQVKTERATAITNAPSTNDTHVIFAIDFSSSMNVSDVQSTNGSNITRWNAVFKCVNSLLDKQLQEQDTVDEQDAGAAASGNKCLISLLTFNNESRVLIHKMTLDGDGSTVKMALRAAEKENKPRGGTSFSAGFHEASILAEGYGNVMVVFLTDGRPGDLRRDPPVDCRYAMQAM
jgi:Mg-chelatase subunit ChlD